MIPWYWALITYSLGIGTVLIVLALRCTNIEICADPGVEACHDLKDN
jgi:hypothetical protein